MQDDYYAKISHVEADNEDLEQWKLGGIFDRNNKIIISDFLSDETKAHKWNTSLVLLKNGEYLFGIHKDEERDIAGKLFLIREDGQVEQVGEGLKNFRLRELKKMSKAKK